MGDGGGRASGADDAGWETGGMSAGGCEDAAGSGNAPVTDTLPEPPTDAIGSASVVDGAAGAAATALVDGVGSIDDSIDASIAFDSLVNVVLLLDMALIK